MEVQVRTWGNSQGIRFPKDIMQEAGIRVNDILQMEVVDGKIVLSRPLPPFRHKTLKERVEESGVPLSGIGELDWGEPCGNEVW